MSIKSDLFNNYAEKELSSKLGAAWEFFQVMPNDEFPKLHDLLPNGTITQDKLPFPLRYFKFEQFFFVKFMYKHYIVAGLMLILGGIWICYIESLVVGLLISITGINYLFVYKYTKIRELIHQGINAFNTENIEQAYNIFIHVQNTWNKYPLFKQYKDVLNDWIVYCLLYLERPKEALDFAITHNVTAKRAKIFFLYLILDLPQEAIDYFKNSFNRDEIDKWPSILVIPALVYSNIIKDPIKTIDFLESYDVLNLTLNNDTYNVYELLAKQYTVSNNKEKLKNLYIKMNKFKPDDIVVAERLKKLLQEE